MPEDFVIAKNAEPGSTLPYLFRIPLGDGIILKAKDTWPRIGKVYCHPVDEWPDDAEVIERVAVRSRVRRGAAVDLVLDRGREPMIVLPGMPPEHLPDGWTALAAPYPRRLPER